MTPQQRAWLLLQAQWERMADDRRFWQTYWSELHDRTVAVGLAADRALLACDAHAQDVMFAGRSAAR